MKKTGVIVLLAGLLLSGEARADLNVFLTGLNTQASANAQDYGLRGGPGNLDKPLSGKSATTTAQRWAQHGADNGKRNQAETFTGIQSKSSVGSDSWRQNPG